ncbi:hypothetical protein GQ607_003927 [Colletotrichum asianum]|uniref:Uncharacterized protein n=1 Tax=Colletotrichum asianum TaxID=702518 RepID=A0A8H3WN78_9PEZI|nr:hypothetical protein GQ607_003927 [Colletotrichum asianum]
MKGGSEPSQDPRASVAFPSTVSRDAAPARVFDGNKVYRNEMPGMVFRDI